MTCNCETSYSRQYIYDRELTFLQCVSNEVNKERLAGARTYTFRDRATTNQFKNEKQTKRQNKHAVHSAWYEQKKSYIGKPSRNSQPRHRETSGMSENGTRETSFYAETA
jgi:hypothetical protein